MEQARVPCQPGFGYHHHHPAEVWMPTHRDSGATPADYLETERRRDIVNSTRFALSQDMPVLKFPHQRSAPYPSSGALLGGPRLGAPPQASGPRSAMARRNERERKRVRLVNHGFATLRQYLPQGSNARKKLSKRETLHSAIEYIKQLQFLLDPTSSSATPSPPLYSESPSDPSWSQPSWDESWTTQQQRSPSPAHDDLGQEAADLIDFAAFS